MSIRTQKTETVVEPPAHAAIARSIAELVASLRQEGLDQSVIVQALDTFGRVAVASSGTERQPF